MVRMDPERCLRCGGCIDFCPVIAIRMIEDVVTVDALACKECNTCVRLCPAGAIQKAAEALQEEGQA